MSRKILLILMGLCALIPQAGSPVLPHRPRLTLDFFEGTGARIGEAVLSRLEWSEGKLVAGLGNRRLEDQELIGLEVQGGDSSGGTVPLRVENVEAKPGQDLSLYTFAYWNGAEKQWKNPCLPDRNGDRRALVLSGIWRGDGVRDQSSSSQFTLACLSGAAGKCARWGYPPWRKFKGRSLEPFHEACTRMVRADYAGDGTPHTIDGMEIVFTDILGVNSGSPSNGMSLEAAWSSKGAVFAAHARRAVQPAEKLGLLRKAEVLILNYSYLR